MHVQLCENKKQREATCGGHRQCTFSSVKTKNNARQRVEVIVNARSALRKQKTQREVIVNARSAYMRTLYSWLGVCHDNGLIML